MIAREISLQDSTGSSVLLLVTAPTPNALWGAFEPIRQTSWAPLVREISAEAYSHALHGWLIPLMRELGPDPHRSAPTRVPLLANKECMAKKHCIGWNPKLCLLGGRSLKKDPLGPPGCYEAPIAPPAGQIALAIAQGRHPIVVIGEEFSLS